MHIILLTVEHRIISQGQRKNIFEEGYQETQNFTFISKQLKKLPKNLPKNVITKESEGNLHSFHFYLQREGYRGNCSQTWVKNTNMTECISSPVESRKF
jgi:hypothetical protein